MDTISNNLPAEIILLVLLGFVIYTFLQSSHRLSGRLKNNSEKKPNITRAKENSILKPIREHSWENEAVFNPAAIYFDDRIHLFYRALGSDGISRIGHASGADGIHFDERAPFPVFEIRENISSYKSDSSSAEVKKYLAKLLRYNPTIYASGGGWGGSEDPRTVEIDGEIFMTCSAYKNWSSIRIMITSISADNLAKRFWNWKNLSYLSPLGQIHKNWVIFPQKINGKYAIIHSITPEIQIEYVDSLEGSEEGLAIKSFYHPHPKSRQDHWDSWVRGAGAPPIKTPQGWLLFYHAIEHKREPDRYKLGVMLLDLDNPTNILYRSSHPLLEPDMPYENDWKPGIIYTCGAVVKDDTILVYYGGGDKTINVATAKFSKFMEELMRQEHKV